MKATPISLLIFGAEPYLLSTRQWVLQSRGYRVVTAATLAQFKALPAQPTMDLLILCHSLSPRERGIALARAKTRWPEIKHLTLVPTSSREPSGILGQLFHTLDGPGALLSQVGTLVGHATSAADTHVY